MAGKSIDLRTRVGVDGEPTYRESLKKIGSELRVLKSEMNAATSAFGENQNSVEALTVKQQALTKQQSVLAERVKLNAELLQMAKDKYGENSEETLKWRKELAYAQTALNKCTTELGKTSTALAEASAAEQAAADGAGEAQKAREAQTAALKELSNEIAQYDAKLRGLKGAEADAMSTDAADKYGLLEDKAAALALQVEQLTAEYERVKAETGAFSDETTRLYQQLESTKQAQAETAKEAEALSQAMEAASAAEQSAADGADEAQKAREAQTAAMKAASNEIAQLDADLRRLSGAEKDALSPDAHVKYSLLQDKAAALSREIEGLSDEYQQVKAATGEYSDETTRAYLNLSQARQEQEKTTQEMESLENAMQAAQQAAEALGESAEEASDGVEDLGDASDDAADKHSAFAAVLAGAASVMSGVVVTSAKAAVAALAAVSAAAVAATKAGFDMSVSAGQYADELLTLSSQSGVAANSLQAWGYASNFIDTSVDQMTQGMTQLTAAMGEAVSGSEDAKAKFNALGISYTDVHGRLRSDEDVFWETIDALHSMTNETARDAMAMQLFGEEAKQLNPLIEAGSAAYKALGEEAKALGVVFTDKELATMGGFDDAMNRGRQTAEGLKNAIGLALIPAFQPLVGRATSAMAKVSLALRDGITPDEVSDLVDELLTEAEGGFDDIAGIIGDALPIVSEALGRLVSALGQKLPGMINRILPAAMGLLKSVFNAITSNAGELGRVAGQLIGQLVSFLLSNLPQLVSGAWQLMQGLMEGLGAAIGPAWEAVKKDVIGVMSGAWDKMLGALGSLAGWASNLFTGIKKKLDDAWGLVSEDVIGVFSGIWSDITGAFGSLTDILANVLNIDRAALQKSIDNATSVVRDIFGGILGVFAPSVNWAPATDAETGNGDEASRSGGGGGNRSFGELSSKGSSMAKTIEKQALSVVSRDVARADADVSATVTTSVKSAMDKAAEVMTADAGTVLGTDWMGGIETGITDGEGNVTAAAGGTMQAVLTALTTTAGPLQFTSIGRNISQGVAVGIRSSSGAVFVAARAMAMGAVSAARSALDIRSPSRKMQWIGEMGGEGFAVGLERKNNRIEAAAQALSNRALTATATAHGSGAIDYAQLGEATASALRQQSGEPIDYDRLGAAVAQANKDSGLGNATMIVDKRELGRTLEPEVNAATAKRGSKTIAGRPGQLVMA